MALDIGCWSKADKRFTKFIKKRDPSEEILVDDLEACQQDPLYCPTTISSYRNFTDDEGYASHFVKLELPSLIRGSALITLFSIFEDNIKQICNCFLPYTNLNISHNDLSGHGATDKLKTVFRILGEKIVDAEKVFYINVTPQVVNQAC